MLFRLSLPCEVFVCLGFDSGHLQVKTEKEPTRFGTDRYVLEVVNGLMVHCPFLECFLPEMSEKLF